jgi:peptidoglycan/LPS O-acetylase OafA/YrhL
LDGLRGVAAALVGAFHLLETYSGGDHTRRIRSSAVIAAALAMPYFAPASSPWVNGLYEAVVILAVFPLVVAMGAGSQGGGRFCRFLGEISDPVYIMHFPLAYMQIAWVKAHASAPLAQHIAVNVSIFVLAYAVAWAALKLYDLPVRAWLTKKGNC